MKAWISEDTWWNWRQGRVSVWPHAKRWCSSLNTITHQSRCLIGHYHITDTMPGPRHLRVYRRALGASNNQSSDRQWFIKGRHYFKTRTKMHSAVLWGERRCYCEHLLYIKAATAFSWWVFWKITGFCSRVNTGGAQALCGWRKGAVGVHERQKSKTCATNLATVLPWFPSGREGDTDSTPGTKNNLRRIYSKGDVS